MFLYIYAKDIIVFVFEYRNFSPESTKMTYPLLQIFALSVFSLSLNTYITRFYYALEKTLLPNVLNIISVFGVNILVIVLWIDKAGAAAIAYGTVISALFNMLLLILFAKTSFDLSICSWREFGKIVLYIVVTLLAVIAIASLPIHNVFLSLMTGGLVTVALIGVGLKTIYKSA